MFVRETPFVQSLTTALPIQILTNYMRVWKHLTYFLQAKFQNGTETITDATLPIPVLQTKSDKLAFIHLKMRFFSPLKSIERSISSN